MAKEFIINVIYDDSDNNPMWVALNDVLPLATEAKTFPLLMKRVNEIAPEMAVENGHCFINETFKLKYIVENQLLAAA